MIQKTKAISIRIEGVLVPTREGRTILEAAREAGRNIPTMCHMDGPKDVGGASLVLGLTGQEAQDGCSRYFALRREGVTR